MEITYFGHSSFRIKTKDATLITDPFDPKIIGIKYPLTDADIVTISHNHPDHNFLERVRGARKVITEPGEYEISNISIIGLLSYHDSKKGEERGTNIIYIYEAEELRIAHLGDLGHQLSDKTLEAIGDINILMINAGHKNALSAEDALEVVREIEPQIILPMHYKIEGSKSDTLTNIQPVDTFLKEAAVPVEKLPKLTLKISDLTEDSQKIVLLEVKK